jgi:hypothetical protein
MLSGRIVEPRANLNERGKLLKLLDQARLDKWSMSGVKRSSYGISSVMSCPLDPLGGLRGK